MVAARKAMEEERKALREAVSASRPVGTRIRDLAQKQLRVEKRQKTHQLEKEGHFFRRVVIFQASEEGFVSRQDLKKVLLLCG